MLGHVTSKGGPSRNKASTESSSTLSWWNLAALHVEMLAHCPRARPVLSSPAGLELYLHSHCGIIHLSFPSSLKLKIPSQLKLMLFQYKTLILTILSSIFKNCINATVG